MTPGASGGGWKRITTSGAIRSHKSVEGLEMGAVGGKGVESGSEDERYILGDEESTVTGVGVAVAQGEAHQVEGRSRKSREVEVEKEVDPTRGIVKTTDVRVDYAKA